MIAGLCTLWRGSPIDVVTALGMAVWQCLTAPRAFGLCLLFCHPLLRFSASVGTVLCSLFGFPCFRVGVLLACGVWGTCWLRSLCSLGCPPWLVLLLLCLFVLHLLLRDRLFGRSLLAPPAAPVGWAPVGSLLRHSVPLASCRTLSFCCFSPEFLPLAFVQAWVGRLRSCLGSSLLLGGALLPLSSLFSLGCSNCLLSRLLEFLQLLAGVSFLSLPVFAVSSEWLTDSPWLSALRCLAAGCVTLFFCQEPCRLALVGPRCLWVPRSCGVPGLRDGVTCLRSGLCSSSVLDRNEDFPSFWWVWFLAFVLGSPSSGWSNVLRPVIVPMAIPPSTWIGPAPSHWVPLLGARCVWGLPLFARIGGVASASPVYSFGMWSPFGSSVSFRHSWLWTKDYIGDCSFPMWPPFFRVELSYSYIILRIVGTSCGWWLRSCLACRCSWTVGCLLLASSAAALWVLGMLTCCPVVVRPRVFGHGVRCHLSCPSVSSFLWMYRLLWFLFSHMVRNLHDGVTPAGRGWCGPQSERRFGFLFPFWADSSRWSHPLGRDCFRSHSLSECRFSVSLLGWFRAFMVASPIRGRVGSGLPRPFAPVASFSVIIPLSFGMRSPLGQVCWLVPTCIRPEVVIYT